MSEIVQQIMNNSCLAEPITPELWKNLQLNTYLENFPGAQNITLSQYAKSVHAANFFCGIGRRCMAGQPCAPVPKMDWLVLYSTQQWNFYMNSLYEAIESAINIVRGLAIFGGSLAGLVLLTAAVIAYVGPIAFVLLDSVAAEAATGETLAVIPTVATTGLVRRHVQETLSTDLFAAYAKLDSDITMLHAKLKTVLFNKMGAILNNPIHSDQGLSNLLKDGVYLTPNPSKSSLQLGAREVAQLTVMSELFKSLHPCTSDGPNGALEGEDVLSYCADDGLMMNIVQADGDHLVEKVTNSHLLESKYGYKTRYLVTEAWSCQQKSVNGTVAPGENRMNSECVFTIPVCDLRIPAIKKQLDDNDGIVVACREAGNLPI
ncbi:uncharacterized protein MELLADRAFT_64810 [Melampsora larici-populina 98AG31]|uniref:DUF7872 domain-containing protein n=1 Tax=Melampsora larici-populina (strain 98AG31 / pathotype 3-4-7) TaxID=747676 RepID=F4RSW1_MELLP|nr:uncharacterized protein MELLADRAFT_64810 [Melampsora larici-populina 98AG31]EGG04399.1 hypothetical protein MELLADRAFT_64810 [Melampsora larici-populina 98AG31]